MRREHGVATLQHQDHIFGTFQLIQQHAVQSHQIAIELAAAGLCDGNASGLWRRTAARLLHERVQKQRRPIAEGREPDHIDAIARTERVGLGRFNAQRACVVAQVEVAARLEQRDHTVDMHARGHVRAELHQRRCRQPRQLKRRIGARFIHDDVIQRRYQDVRADDPTFLVNAGEHSAHGYDCARQGGKAFGLVSSA